MSIATITWTPWSDQLHQLDQHWRDDALDCAESWLGDFGLGLLCGSKPDAWSRLDNEHWAFRFDSLGRSIVLLVTVDYDPPASCVSIEVRR
jgi:hypothetical protein